jgi:hypothetical protein
MHKVREYQVVVQAGAVKIYVAVVEAEGKENTG